MPRSDNPPPYEQAEESSTDYSCQRTPSAQSSTLIHPITGAADLPWTYPPEYHCTKCHNKGYKAADDKMCKDCWKKFSPQAYYEKKAVSVLQGILANNPKARNSANKMIMGLFTHTQQITGMGNITPAPKSF